MRIVVAAAVLLSACAPEPPRDPDLPRAVAHALGEAGGRRYLNVREGFDASYARGCRAFEADFWIASDRKVVVMHDGIEQAIGIEKGFASTEYLALKPFGLYTTLDVEGIAALMAEKKDWILVTDAKSEQMPTLAALIEAADARGVAWRQRIVPQAYHPDEVEPISALGFARIVFTTYRLVVTDRALVSIAKKHRSIVAVTMPKERFSESIAKKLDRVGVRTYVHTINGASEVQKIVERGAWGVYTDTECAAP